MVLLIAEPVNSLLRLSRRRGRRGSSVGDGWGAVPVGAEGGLSLLAFVPPGARDIPKGWIAVGGEGILRVCEF